MGSKEHIINVYIRGRDDIINNYIKDDMGHGLILIQGFICQNWDAIQLIMKEDLHNNE